MLITTSRIGSAGLLGADIFFAGVSLVRFWSLFFKKNRNLDVICARLPNERKRSHEWPRKLGSGQRPPCLIHMYGAEPSAWELLHRQGLHVLQQGQLWADYWGGRRNLCATQ